MANWPYTEVRVNRGDDNNVILTVQGNNVNTDVLEILGVKNWQVAVGAQDEEDYDSVMGCSTTGREKRKSGYITLAVRCISRELWQVLRVDRLNSPSWQQSGRA